MTGALSSRARLALMALTWRRSPRGLVAWNHTPLNLRRQALREGADYYAAVSRRGAVLAAGRAVALPPAPPGWSQPYPNLWLLPPGSPGTFAHEAQLLCYLYPTPEPEEESVSWDKDRVTEPAQS